MNNKGCAERYEGDAGFRSGGDDWRITLEGDSGGRNIK